MKTALYIEGGTLQVILTSDTKAEKAIVDLFRQEPLHIQIRYGEFYPCVGGWTRQGIGDDSLILILSCDLQRSK